MEKNLIKCVPYEGNKNASIVYETKELIALCPKTGLPDIYTLKITYTPNAFIPELYSLKKYLSEYIHIKIFIETLASDIFNDFKTIIKPIDISLILSESNPFGLYPSVYL